ncbi:MAG: tagatose-bisphosphate aldolase [Phycisphaerales bacterium]|nr:tagatose-bisphosphate aldolase [Phycisphaerales bacterium]
MLLRPAFRFIDHGPLVDRELELVPAQPRWADDVLAACHHPLTVAQMPREARLSRTDIDQFLAEAPFGRFPGDPVAGRVPSYQFWMLLRHSADSRWRPPPIRIAGGLSLRVGSNPSVELHYGHVGYHVYPPARGHRYAYRAARLVLPLLRAHGLPVAWITCDPDNHPSRRTIERLGGRYVETVPVPEHDPLYARGETHKCRFRLDLR